LCWITELLGSTREALVCAASATAEVAKRKATANAAIKIFMTISLHRFLRQAPLLHVTTARRANLERSVTNAASLFKNADLALNARPEASKDTRRAVVQYIIRLGFYIDSA
jgi:hypothetical protein